MPVTAGFQPASATSAAVCPQNRRRAAIPGRTSKITRYYWRDLFFEATRATGEWVESHPSAIERERRQAHATIEKQALERIKAEHARAPKYVFSELFRRASFLPFFVEVSLNLLKRWLEWV